MGINRNGRLVGRNEAAGYTDRDTRAPRRLRWLVLQFAAIRSLSLLTLFVCGTTVLTDSDQTFCDDRPPDLISPAHVFVHVSTVRAELEELRFMMGRPANKQPKLAVKSAAPREVYFQAMTLFRKADRLCFEHTRERAAPPKLATGAIRPDDVHKVVDASLQCVRHVSRKYGIESHVTPGPHDDSKLPTDVFQSIVQANRQLNLMLERRFAPEDVFHQLTRGVGYASCLLEQVSEADTIPDEPVYEAGKRPADVYRRLLDCFERIRNIAKLSDLEVLELHVDDVLTEQADPSDVYDIASLIVAELAWLHSRLPDARPPREAYYVGRKFPSHVFQRAGVLEAQLVELERFVAGNPTWLKAEPANK